MSENSAARSTVFALAITCWAMPVMARARKKTARHKGLVGIGEQNSPRVREKAPPRKTRGVKNGGLIGKRLRKTPAIARMVAGTGKKSRLNVLQKDAARTLIPGFNAFEPFYAIRNATLVGMVQTIDGHDASFYREEAVLREEVRQCQPFEHLFAL